MDLKSKFLRVTVNQMLDYLLSNMEEDESVLFLTIFKEKLQESLDELKAQLTVPSGENKK